MSRRGWYLLILAGMVALYAFMCLKLDKFGAVAPATLCGFPVWIITAVALGLFLFGGTQYRPVVNPGDSSETPGCVLQLFIGFFFIAMFLGIVFTEPVMCTAKDGDTCYEYGTYKGTRNDGSTYYYSYRNSWVWITDPATDIAIQGTGSLLDNMDFDDSEAAIFIVIVIVLLILVLCSAFIPNMWVLACALCIGATYLTLLRMSNEENATKRKRGDLSSGDAPPKPKNDTLLSDPGPVPASGPDFPAPNDPSLPTNEAR